MKKKLLLILVFILLINIKSKSQSYTFSHTTATYSDLTAPIIVSSPYWDDFSQYYTVLPFQFAIYGIQFDTIYFQSDLVSFTNDFSHYGIASYSYSKLVDNTTQTANISYQNFGTAPNRIFKLQIKNAAFYNNSSGADYTNYQLWLFELSNKVEIHYGPNSVQDPLSWTPGATGPGVAIAVDVNQILTLNGPAANPTAYTSTSTLTINGAPANGMVYVFTPASTSVIELEKIKTFVLYPNPSTGCFKVFTENLSNNAEFSVFDLTGKKVYYSNAFDNLSIVNLSLAKGMYYAEIRDGDKMLRRSIVIE